MTQPELITKYVQTYGSITPAKLGDKQRAFLGEWIGSEAARVCRKLRAEGKFTSTRQGKFETFYLKDSYDTAAKFLRDWPSKPKDEPKGQLF